MTRGGKAKLGKARTTGKVARSVVKVLRSKTWARKASPKGLPEDRANSLSQELTRRARSQTSTKRISTGKIATPEEARARREARRSSS